MEVKERKSKKKHPSKIVGSPEDLTKRHSTKPKTDTHVGQKSDGGLDSQPKKKKKQKEAVSQKTSPNVSIAVNTPVDQVGERKKKKKKKKQLSNIGESQEDLIQKHPTEQKASDVHLGEKSQGGLDNQPKKKKKKKKEKEAVSQETNAGASIAANTPVDHVGVGKKKKKQLSNIGESPEDLILKHPTKHKALDIHGGEESQGGLDNQPKKKKKKKGKEAASQEASAGVSIAVNAPVEQVGHRKKKKKQPSDVGEIPEDFIQKHPTKHKALAFHVGENSEGGLDNQPKKEEEEELREAILQETSAGVSSAVDTTPVDQVGGRKKRKKQLSDIGESPEDLIQEHPTKQKALAFHVGEKSEGSLDNQSKKKKKKKKRKKKKKEEEAVPQETSPGVSNPENTLVDQVGEEAERKRMKKQLGKIGGSSEDLTQKLPTKRKASEFSVGQESDGGPDNRPKKKKKKAKEAVSQASSPGVAIAGNAPVDRQMRPETALTTPLDQRMKPETILVTPDTSLPNSSTLITPDTALPISLGRGGTTTASIQTTAGQMSKHKLTTARSFFVKGGLLDQILEKLSRAIESAKHTKGQVRDNIWFKQKFSVGLNDVTRTLERMPPALCKSNMNDVSDIEHLKNVQEAMQHFPALQDSHLEDKGPGKQSTGSLGKPDQLVQLQAVLVAHDCHPRVLIGHLPVLASSRGVPLLYVEDHGKGSLRLGEILMLRAAIAIGIKVGESPINKTMQDILDDQSTRYQKK